METQQEKINQLKEYFANRDDVIMAFLFGSRAKATERTASDWDIGVYFKPRSYKVEWETEHDYPEKNTIWGDMTEILNTDNVDLVVLNKASASVAVSVIRGIPLVVKDRSIYLKFLLIITGIASDYRKLVDDYYAIFERSRSLIEEDRLILKKRLMFLEDELTDLAVFKKLTQQKYLEDRNSKRSVERWVENLINASLDITKTLLASEHKPIPATYKEILWSLQLLGEFPKDVAEKFASWASLRNILAHEYLDIRWKEISAFIQEAEPHFKKFIERVKKYITPNKNRSV